MKVEIREDSVFITGYVNAVERYSKPITENIHGKIRTFIERVKCGTFKKALKRNDDVKVLLNHDYERELATTKDGTANLFEDNIGLRAEVTIKDKDVIEKAKNDELVGWSFGFRANDDVLGTEGEQETRTITDLDLIEVSILDSSKSPAYIGTSIEAREEKAIETRSDDIYDMQHMSIEEEAYKQHMSIEEEAQMLHKQIEQEKEKAKVEMLANTIVEKLMEKFNITLKEMDQQEPTQEEEPRSIDYSNFEERLRNL